MRVPRRLFALLVLAALPPLHAVELPPSCAEQAQLPEAATAPIAELRARVEALNETEPLAAFRLLCATTPRVAREHGEGSLALAWWVQALATPLIAYMDRHAEAVPLLEYVEPILLRELGADSPELAELHVAYAWMSFRQGKLAESGTHWESALRIREKVPGERQIELQKILVGLAQVRLAQREFAAARAHLASAQGILRDNGEAVSEAAAAIENVLTNIAMREEDYEVARAHAEALLAIERQLPRGPAQLVPAHVLLGQVLERLDEYEQAERSLREAVRLAESASGPLQRHHLRALTQLAALLHARGKLSEALPFARRAVEVGETELGAAAPTLVRVLQIRADIHRSLGELPQALALYQRAGEIVAAHRGDVERPVLVSYNRGLGALQLALGNREGAVPLLRQALEAAGDDATLSTERAGVLLALARVDSGTAPRDQLVRALELYRSRLPDQHPTVLRVINELCGIEIDSGAELAEHCADAAQRVETAREVEPALRHEVYANQSRLAARRAQSEAAYRLAVEALAAAETLGTPDPAWRALYRVAQLLDERGEPSIAIFFGKQAIGRIEALRHALRGEERRLQSGFLRDKLDTYRAVADWLMHAGRMDEALEVLGLLKAEELYEFVLRNAPAAGDAAPGPELTSEERRLASRYTKLLRADALVGREIDRLTVLAEANRATPEERRRLDELLVGQRAAETARAGRIREFIAGEAGTSTRGGTVRTVIAARLARELERYGPESAIGVYLLTDTHLRLLVATRDGQFEHRAPVDARALRRDVGRFLDAIARREDVLARSRALYDRLAKPLDEAARRAGARQLVLWPDDALRYVPFAALHDGRQYLVERYALQIYSDVTSAGEGIRTSELSVRGLGVTQPVAGFRALPAVADELCHIVRGPIEGLVSASTACPAPSAGNGALPGEGFADAAFTEARFSKLLESPRDFSVLHLGTHFSLRPGNALRSFLVLGDGSQLTLDRINALDFAGIELTTLSACQTGMGGAVTDDGREIEGLAAIVQRRGAKRVIASLWHVEDASTARLMRHLYDELAQGAGDAARALQRAQLQLRGDARRETNRLAHPYHWAGFVLSGAP